MSDKTNDEKKELNELVSIVVPVYGVAQYLKRCLDSLVNQTYSNLEIILVDDGSIDGSAQICDEYAAKDSRVVVIHKDNEGRVVARKTGVEKCHGMYTAYIDGDDWVDQEYIKKLHDHASTYNADMVICTCICEGDSSEVEDLYFEEGLYDKNLLKQKIYPRMIFTGRFDEFGIRPHVYKLYKTDLLMEYQKRVPDSICIGEDAALVYPMLIACERIYILNEPLYHYRYNENGITLKYNELISKSSTILNMYLRRQLPAEYLRQLDYYHCLMALTNAVNTARGGMNTGFGKRLEELLRYYKDSEIGSSIKRCDFRNIDISNAHLAGVFLLKLGLYRTVVVLYIIKNRLTRGVKQKRHG